MRSKIFLIAVITVLLTTVSYAKTITGAGSTFIYPVLSTWTKDYQEVNGQSINYQGVGSSAGISQLKQATIDFAASDKPATQ